jgi:Ca2+-binding EF-hand superfamily protein
MRKIIAGSVAALAIAAAIPLVATAGSGERGGQGMRGGHHGEHGMRGHHGEEHGGRRGRLHIQEMLETYDADGDGSIAQAEVDEWRTNRLREFDADSNGQLSLDEYQALWFDAMRERMVDEFQAHDDDGDGQVTVDEFGERTSRLVMMRDRNEDGVLNLDDARRGRHGEDRQVMRGMQGGTMPGMQGGTMPGMQGGTMPGMQGGTMPGIQGGAPAADATETEDTSGAQSTPGDEPAQPAAPAQQ